jgi:PAS domain S-box-containing protein
MLNTITASVKLYLLVFVMCLFIIGAGVYGISELKKMNRNTQSLYSDRVVPLEQLTMIRYTLGNILSAVDQSQANHLSFQQTTKEIQAAGAKIKVNWNGYMSTYLTPEERILAIATSDLITHSVQIMDRLEAVLNKQDSRSLDSMINAELYPAINPVMENLNELIDLQVRVGGELFEKSTAAYHTALKQFLVLILLSLGLTIPFSYYLVRSVKHLIADLHQSNKNLAKNEQKYRALIGHAGDAIIVTDTETLIVEANDHACKLLGYTRVELLQMKFSQLINVEDFEKQVTMFKPIHKDAQLLTEMILRKKDGSLVETEINTRLLEGEGYISIFRNITERKRTEEIVKESERKYRNIFENVQDVFFQSTLDGTIIEVSPSVKSHTGFSREEIIGTNSGNLYYNPAEREAGLALLVDKGEVTNYEFRFKSRNDQLVYVSLNARLIAGTNGTPDHIDGLFRNITGRKRMEEELRRSEASLKEAQAIANTGNWETDFLNNIHSWSDEVFNIVGTGREEIQPSIDALLSFIHPEDLDIAKELITVAFDKCTDSTANFRLVRNDAVIRYAHIEWRFEFDNHNHPKRLYGILQDITERKKTEESIKQSEANYRQMFDLSPAPMWVTEEETYRFIQVNQSSIKNYGYSKEEFAGMTIMNLSPNQYKTDISRTRMLKNNEFNPLFMGGRRHRKKSGEIIDVETSSIPVVLNGKNRILVVAIDITEKNRYEHKLTRAAIKVQEDERYEIGGELHDNVCQILATSLLYLNMLKPRLAPESTEYFDQTHRYISQASGEIRNLSHRLAPAFFDEESLQDAFENLLRNFNVENKYDISFDCNMPAPPPSISRDLQLNLYRILQEQLGNIVKYANASRIEVGISTTGNILQMRISDNGVGFDLESNKSGIGMANMNRRAQMFSGNFSVYSVPGNGCEIQVEIPLPGTN